MTCQEVEKRLSRFVDGDLDADERAAVSSHLDTCAGCRAIASDLTRVRDAARALGPVAPPEHIWLEIAGQIRLGDRPTPADAPSPAPRAASAMWQWLGLAAGLVLVTLVAYLVVHLRAPVPATTTAGNGGAPAPSNR